MMIIRNWTVEDFLKAHEAYCEYHTDARGQCDQNCEFCIKDINVDNILDKIELFYAMAWATYKELAVSIFCESTANHMINHCFPCDIFDTDSKNWNDRISAKIVKDCKMMF